MDADTGKTERLYTEADLQAARAEGAAAADKLVSAIHDAIYAEPFDRQRASDAVWRLHELLRARSPSSGTEAP